MNYGDKTCAIIKLNVYVKEERFVLVPGLDLIKRIETSTEITLVDYVCLRRCSSSSFFFISQETFASKDNDSVRNRRILVFVDNSMKDEGYNLHFPCLICTFMIEHRVLLYQFLFAEHVFVHF